jgi:eukaryotic-like serine/threonine-protein kinase
MIITASSISKRYITEEMLGQGGMGVVFKSKDRLTGQSVAVKQVLANASSALLNSITEGIDLRLALTQEFNALASLRHPNVIGVLDYGFDDDNQPYFVMDYLPNASSILDAAAGKPLAQQVTFIAQLLQALAYIHRRGIIHRDLKPGNVLVSDGQVRVLDFGLSIMAGQAQDANNALGTLTYMAPETLSSSIVSSLSDLYTVGVIAYEMLAGKHPFDTSSVSRLLTQIESEPPDLKLPTLDKRSVPFLAKLLHKNPADRFASADEALDALHQAFGDMLAPEDEAIRESYLQAAQFVGREKEYDQLSEALVRTIGGLGSGWLVGGESGVGKSRLLNELRTLALVRGMNVLRGQTLSEASSPFQVWRDVVRVLVLLTELQNDEASVLKAIVPDIGTLIERAVVDAPDLEPQAAQARLFGIVEALLRRQVHPTLIVLEDLQWAGTESLALLAWLSRADLPVMLVGSFRDEERPDLPRELPAMKVIKLNRLNRDGIAKLGASMLGPAAKVTGLVELLQKETEGNPFFLVEVVRILAAEAGNLKGIMSISLPQSILAGGVMNVINRRLQSILPADRPFLELAAVAGRQLNLALLRTFDSAFNFEAWLTRCANLALLELQDGRWRFTHDKLRERLLSDLPADQRKQYHLSVAQGIEATYPNLEYEAVSLAYHWQMAGDLVKELRYTAIAAEQELRNDANKEAVQFFTRALELDGQLHKSESLSNDVRLRRAQWRRSMGSAYYSTGRLTESRDQYRESLLLLGTKEATTKSQKSLRLTRELARQLYHRVRPQGMTRFDAKKSTLRLAQARSYRELAETYYYTNDVLPAVTASFQALNLCEKAYPSAELAQSYADTCIMSGFLSMHNLAETYSRLALETAEKLNDEATLTHTRLRLSLYRLSVAQWSTAREMLESAIDIYSQRSDRFGKSRSMGPLMTILRYEGQYDKSVAMGVEYYTEVKQRNDVFLSMWAASGLAATKLRQGKFEEAEALLQESLEILTANPNKGGLIRTYGLLAAVLLLRERPMEAREAADQALELITQVSSASLYAVVEGYVFTAETLLSLWEMSASQAGQETYSEKSQQACKALTKLAKRFSCAKPNALMCEGRMQWLNGQQEAALNTWDKALKEAQLRNMPYEEAAVHELIAAHLPRDHSSRLDQYKAAHMLYSRIGAVYDQARVAPFGEGVNGLTL